MIEVPPSVLAYFQNRDVETAVDHLLEGDKGKKTKLTGVSDWRHLAGYYRATLAARQTPVEFAIFLEELWRVVWTEMPRPWRAVAPSDAARPDLAVNVATIWDENCFGRRFEKDGLALELYVGLWTEGGLQLGVLLYEDKDKTVLADHALPGWARSDDYDTHWTDWEIVPLQSMIDPAPLKAAADAALSVVNCVLAQR